MSVEIEENYIAVKTCHQMKRMFRLKVNQTTYF